MKRRVGEGSEGKKECLIRANGRKRKSGPPVKGAGKKEESGY